MKGEAPRAAREMAADAVNATPCFGPGTFDSTRLGPAPPSLAAKSRFRARFKPFALGSAAPVVNRELRAEARNPFNYLMRLLGAGVVIVVFGLMMMEQTGNSAQMGALLFPEMVQALFVAVMVCVPMLTADCISREKREGTLGLLFLTPLAARDIVIGKSLIHAVRAFTLLLAVLPVVLLPLVLGGASGWSVIWAVTFNLSGALLALAAGLLASVRNVEWIQTVVVAEALSAGFALVLLGLPWAAHYGFRSWGALEMWVTWLAQPAIAIGVFIWAVRDAGAKLDRIWQKEITDPPQPKWVKVFAHSKFWRAAFRWDTRRALDRNPIAWLQEYSWTARLTKWGWCMLVFATEVILMFNYQHLNFSDWQRRLAVSLALGLAFSAAWSFRRDRQSGALELLLVAPLGPRHLAGGRLWGIWCHFFPAFAILLFVWIYSPFYRSRADAGMIWFCFFSYLTLPALGMFFSLSRLHFLVAWLMTSAVGLLLPYFIGTSSAFYTRRSFGLRMAPYIVMGLLQILLAAAAWYLVQRNLKRRAFALEQTSA